MVNRLHAFMWIWTQWKFRLSFVWEGEKHQVEDFTLEMFFKQTDSTIHYCMIPYDTLWHHTIDMIWYDTIWSIHSALWAGGGGVWTSRHCTTGHTIWFYMASYSAICYYSIWSCMILCDMVWCDTICYNMTVYDTLRYHMVLQDSIQYYLITSGMISYDTLC